MLIAEELQALTEKLQTTASAKELAFFQFLINEPIAYSKKKNLSEIEQVCFAAFCLNSPDRSKQVEKLQKTRPIKGMHYTNNLIELAACARADSNKELDNLKAYAKSHSARDFFILDKLFPGMLSNPPAPVSSIDKVSTHLLNDDFPADWQPTFLDAIAKSSDLLDVYILRRAYARLMDAHPNTEQTADITSFLRQLQSTIKQTDSLTHILLILLVVSILVRIYVSLIPFIINKWDVAEPMTAALGYLIGGVSLVILLLIRRKPDKLKVFMRFEQGISNQILKMLGIDRNQVTGKANQYGVTDSIVSPTKGRTFKRLIPLIPLLLIATTPLWMPRVRALISSYREPEIRIPDYRLRLVNNSDDNITIQYRGEFYLWLPQGLSDQARYTEAGRVEFHRLDGASSNEQRLIVPAKGELEVLATLLNPIKYKNVFQAGETDLSFILIRQDGSKVIGSGPPFSQEGMSGTYAEVDVARK